MKPETNLKRRKFLLAASLGGAGAVAAVIADVHVAPEPALVKAAPAPEPKGYRASEHVRRYYRSTRI